MVLMASSDGEVPKSNWWAARMTWADVEKKGCRGKRVRPKPRRHIGVKKKSANTVVESAEYTFSAAILPRCVRTCEAKDGAMRSEEIANNKVIEFFPLSIWSVCMGQPNCVAT